MAQRLGRSAAPRHPTLLLGGHHHRPHGSRGCDRPGARCITRCIMVAVMTRTLGAATNPGAKSRACLTHERLLRLMTHLYPLQAIPGPQAEDHGDMTAPACLPDGRPPAAHAAPPGPPWCVVRGQLRRGSGSGPVAGPRFAGGGFRWWPRWSTALRCSTHAQLLPLTAVPPPLPMLTQPARLRACSGSRGGPGCRCGLPPADRRQRAEHHHCHRSLPALEAAGRAEAGGGERVVGPAGCRLPACLLATGVYVGVRVGGGGRGGRERVGACSVDPMLRGRGGGGLFVVHACNP